MPKGQNAKRPRWTRAPGTELLKNKKPIMMYADYRTCANPRCGRQFGCQDSMTYNLRNKKYCSTTCQELCRTNQA
jgi:hypothetical protein